jgi:antitoxin MazE
MKAKIIKIGNSKGIRIPKSTLKDCGFGDEVEMQVKKNNLILSPVKKPREGWAEQFKKLTKKYKDGEDDLKDFREFTTEWEENEWEW